MIRQNDADGTPSVTLLQHHNIAPGIKVERRRAVAGCPGETVTEGLDGPRERLDKYRGLGARFAKRRSGDKIGDGMPSRPCLSVDAMRWPATPRSVRNKG